MLCGIFLTISVVKNLVRWCQIFEVLQLQPQKRAKRSNLRVCRDSWSFTCSSKTVHYHTELARCWVFGSKMPDFMFPCCSVL